MARPGGNPDLKPGPGRPKGLKNKIPSDLKEKILFIMQDLESKGKGLHDCAEKDPAWFFENFIKPSLPKNISLTGKMVNEITVRFVSSDKK